MGPTLNFRIVRKLGFLSGFFTSTGIKEMLERKDDCAVDAFFPFLAAFLDTSLRSSSKPVLSPLPALYFDIVIFLYIGTGVLNALDQLVSSLQEMDDILKKKEKEIVGGS